MSQATYNQIAVYGQVLWAIVFIAALVWAWIKFLQPAVMSANDAANKRIAEAERHRDEAKASLAVLRDEIEGAERDATSIRTRSAEFAAHEREAALNEARQAGERAVRNAGGELERARAAAREAFRAELLEKALDLAKNDATKRVDAGLNAKLVGDFMSSVAKGVN